MEEEPHPFKIDKDYFMNHVKLAKQIHFRDYLVPIEV